MPAQPRRSTFDRIEEEFCRVSAPPLGLAVDGRRAGGALPSRPIGLTELRALLLRSPVPAAAADGALRQVLARVRAGERAWQVGLVGVLLPGLARVAARTARGYPGDAADVESEVLAGVLEAAHCVDLGARHLAGRLVNAAHKRAHRLLEAEWSQATRRSEGRLPSSPPRPWGHPDLVLAEAVREGVITTAEARLIGETRLEGMDLCRFAAARGLPYDRVQKRRKRAERRLVAWLRDEDLPPDAEISLSETGPRRGIRGVRVGLGSRRPSRRPPFAPWPRAKGGSALRRQPRPRDRRPAHDHDPERSVS